MPEATDDAAAVDGGCVGGRTDSHHNYMTNGQRGRRNGGRSFVAVNHIYSPDGRGGLESGALGTGSRLMSFKLVKSSDGYFPAEGSLKCY